MRRALSLLLLLLAPALIGCPETTRPEEAGTTAAPARGSGATAALLPPSAQSAQSAVAPAKPKVVAQTALPGLGPLASDDQIGPPTTISLEEAVAGVIEAPGDVDRFQVFLAAGRQLEVEAHSYGEIQLELYDPSGARLAAGSRSLSASIAHPGTYSLAARAQAGQGLHYNLVARTPR